MFAPEYSLYERILIKMLRKAKVPVKEIAEQLGRPYRGLCSYISDHKLFPKPKIAVLREHREEIIRLREEGISAPEIAGRFKVTPKVVYKFFIELDGRRIPLHES